MFLSTDIVHLSYYFGYCTACMDCTYGVCIYHIYVIYHSSYPQKQAGLNWIGVHVPMGRLSADEVYPYNTQYNTLYLHTLSTHTYQHNSIHPISTQHIPDQHIPYQHTLSTHHSHLPLLLHHPHPYITLTSPSPSPSVWKSPILPIRFMQQ